MSFSSCSHCKCRELAKQWFVGDLIPTPRLLSVTPRCQNSKILPLLCQNISTNKARKTIDTNKKRQSRLWVYFWNWVKVLARSYHWSYHFYIKNWILITTVFIMMSRVLIIWWWLLLMEWEVISVYCWSACQPLITALIWNPLTSTDCVYVCSLFVLSSQRLITVNNEH